MKNSSSYDLIVIGSGMGGMSAASMFAKDGYRVLILEAAHAPGGCSSSYYRKGYTFESGATTLIGFDEHQPLRILEDHLGISLPKTAIEPSMTVHLDGDEIVRWQDQDRWLKEAIIHFGEPSAQREFWSLAHRVSKVVWKVSGKNPLFPPQQISDWFHLLKNDPRDVWVLPYALSSVKEIARRAGITNAKFYRFLDEQLMISAQAPADDTPFLFGAPAITYTNSTNYTVQGGLIEMVKHLQRYVEERGGELHTKEKVTSLDQKEEGYIVTTSKNRRYRAPLVVSNIPVWNMGDITTGKVNEYFKKESAKYDRAWGAFTMGVATTDSYPENMSLHHQIHIGKEDQTQYLQGDSIFVSLSHPNDNVRGPEGDRVLNISTHVEPEQWFNLNGEYDRIKAEVQEQILEILVKKLPGFQRQNIKVAFSSTPVTWADWVYRKKGRVGGIPQQMDRSLLDWTPNKTPFEGLYLVGDTVFPGQGIPGVTLSGINVYYRVQKNHKK